jgi:hypothetical protein
MYQQTLPEKTWDLVPVMVLGAILGLGAAMAHEVWHVIEDDFSYESPIAHILLEVCASMIGGASVLAVVSEVRNWRIRSRG